MTAAPFRIPPGLDRAARYADLLRRRADVYSPARGRHPYYGDDDIDLLLSMLDEAWAEMALLRDSPP
jgi:hypothetical protein